MSNNNWSNLPAYKPAADLWDRIETDLDVEVVSENVSTLPKYTPKTELWETIHRKLFYQQVLRYIYFSGITIVVGLLLYFAYHTKDKAHDTAFINDIKLKNNVATANNNTIVATTKSKDASLNTVVSDKKETSNTSSENMIYSNKERNTTDVNPTSKTSYNNKNKYIDKAKSTSETTSDKIQTKNNDETKQIEKDQQTNITTEVSANLSNPIVKAEENKSVETNAETVVNNVSDKPAVNPIATDKEGAKVPISKLDIATSSIEKQKYYSIGLVYTYNSIKNKNKFSYSDINNISQYGVSGKVTYADWVFQTAINYSSFTDKIKYNADIRISKYINYTYVDSVIYSPSSSLIQQYVTHQVLVNDIETKTKTFVATKRYSILNIPVLVGYQWRINKFSLTIKTGVQCSVVLSEKQELQQVDNNMSIVELHPFVANIRRTNWAGIISCDLGYSFYKHLNISIEPVIQYYFNPIYNEMDVNTGLPYTIGIRTGIFYNF